GAMAERGIHKRKRLAPNVFQGVRRDGSEETPRSGLEIPQGGQMSETVRVYGNPEVVELAKMFLEHAEEGKLTYAAVAATDFTGDKACFAHAGSYDGMPGTIIGLGVLKNELEDTMRKRKSGPTQDGTSANYVEYNLATDPISFDFAHW